MTFSLRTSTRRLAGGAAVAAMLVSSPSLRAQPADPQSFDPSSVTGWLLLETDIRPEQVVAVTRDSVSAIVEDRGQREGARTVVVRTEALERRDVGDPLSSSVEVSVDCGNHLTRQGALTAHTQHNLAGSGQVAAPQEDDWHSPGPRTQLESVWRAVCDPTFRGPLAPQTLATGPTPRATEEAKPPSPAPPARPAAPRAKAKPQPSAPAPAGSGLVLQVGAYATKAEANQARSSLEAGLLKGRTIQVQPVQVEKKTYYRVLAPGFRDSAQAQAACAKLKAAGKRCFIKAAAKIPQR